MGLQMMTRRVKIGRDRGGKTKVMTDREAGIGIERKVEIKRKVIRTEIEGNQEKNRKESRRIDEINRKVVVVGIEKRVSLETEIRENRETVQRTEERSRKSEKSRKSVRELSKSKSRGRNSVRDPSREKEAKKKRKTKRKTRNKTERKTRNKTKRKTERKTRNPNK